MFNTLIYIDGHEDIEKSLQLVEVSGKLNKSNIQKITGITTSTNLDVSGYGVDELIIIDFLDVHDTKEIAKIIAELYNENKYKALLFPSTLFGKMIAPKVAASLNVGIVADVTSIELEDELVMIRPAFNGDMLAGITIDSAMPIVMTIRPNTFSSIKNNTNLKCTKYMPKLEFKKGILLKECISVKEEVDITKSKILVSGGGGAKKSFSKMTQLAKLLNADVSCSRALVDEGIISRSYQVGQTGKIVNPDIYISLGIHGTSHHMAGLNKVKNIISVNRDINAPICSYSTIVVNGDVDVFLTKIINKIKEHS